MRRDRLKTVAMTDCARRRFHIMLLVLLLALAGVVFAGLALGSSSIGANDVVAYAMGNASDMAVNVLANVRVPRVLGGVLAGAALAEAGALIQATLNNPLASSNIIGVNAGSGLFVLLFACVAPHALGVSAAGAFAGALASALLVFFVSLYAGASRLTIVLAGIALTSIFTAGMNAILIFNPDAYVNSSGFLVGSLSGVMASELVIPGCAICVGLLVAAGQGTRLNILSLGDEGAHALGLNVQRTRLILLSLAALLAGAAVSFAGLIGFVGLVVPHIVRFFVGHDNRRVLLLSPVVGAIVVCACDTVARTLFAPFEIPVGICMALIGGPFFIYLILRSRKGEVDGRS